MNAQFVFKTFTRYTVPLFCIILLVSQCKKKKTDEDILREKLDTTKVHLYLGLKSALADKQQHDAVRKLIDNVFSITGGILSTIDDRAYNKEKKPEMSKEEILQTIKILIAMKKAGAELLHSGEDKKMPPVLPQLLGNNFQNEGYNANTEHALFTFFLTLAKFHPKAPVPIPPEIILYEASRIDMDDLQKRGIAEPFHALRSYTFAGNELCDLAESENKKAFTIEKNSEKIRQIYQLVSHGKIHEPQISELQKRMIYAFFESLAHGSVAICYFNRDEEEKGREALDRFLDTVEGAGIRIPETGLLRAYVYCSRGKETAPQGIDRLNEVLKDPACSGDIQKEVQLMMNFCKTSAGTSSDIIRKISLYSTMIQLSIEISEQSGLKEQAESSAAYTFMRKTAGGIDALLEFTQTPPPVDNIKENISEKASTVKDATKGLLDRISNDD